MATIYAFKNFNNYYNRKLKGQNILTIDNFVSAYGDFEYMETGSYLNFNPNDGVRTSHVLGRPGYINYNGNCDYVVYCEDNVNITSRWFIVEQPRKMVGQYTLSLKRDSIADNWDVIKNSPMFIEKATLNDANKLIYNDENFVGNQIKTNQELIKDSTGIPWLVGFLARKDGENPKAYTGTFIPDYTADIVLDTPITEWSYYTYATNWFNAYPIQNAINMYAWRSPFFNFQIKWTLKQDGFDKDWWNTGSSSSGTYEDGYWLQNEEPDITTIWNQYKTQALTNNVSAGIINKSQVDTQAFLDLNGLTVMDNTGITYTISFIEEQVQSQIQLNAGNSVYDLLYQPFYDYFNNTVGVISTINKIFETNKIYKRYKLVLQEVQGQGQTYSYNIPINRQHLLDGAYDMVCMPYGVITEKEGNNTYTSDKNINLALANQLMIDSGNFVYDFEVVPYCPLPDSFFTAAGEITTTSPTQRGVIQVTPAGGSPTTIGFIYNCSTSSFTFNIAKTLTINNKKIESQCDMYRLCSPNYNSQFEFNVAKNNGVDYFNVDCTYKPNQCYVHVNPNFKELYGNDYNDSRGLIFFGEPITRLTNAWAEYQLNNKTYQESFDRQIQNMEVQNKYQNIQNAVSGTLGALSAGATAGMLTGNAAIGATAGIASGIGAIADIGIAKALQAEAIDYTKDQFGFRLANIKALPQTISKTTSLTYNNALFPVLEYYTCTNEEKKALANKIAYNGMAVGVIGYIKDYIDNTWSWENITDKGYIKGKIIRLEGIAEDSHLLNDIANELDKGVYTK